MVMEWANLLISLASGIVAGNIVGLALPADKYLGLFGNTLAGLFGGVAGNYILQFMGIIAQVGILGAEGAHPAVANLDLPSILANAGTAGGCGALLVAIVGYIKGSMQNPA